MSAGLDIQYLANLALFQLFSIQLENGYQKTRYLAKYLLSRDGPDIRFSIRYQAKSGHFSAIRYPAGYRISKTGYPVSEYPAGYPANRILV